MILLDKLPRRNQLYASASQLLASDQRNGGSQPGKQRARKAEPDSSETEPESDNEELLLNRGKLSTLPTPAPELESEVEPEPGRAPGKIVGTTYPLADFKRNIARGDVVTKAVEDLGVVIKEIVLRPFASRRTGELLECMKELRKVASEEDEIDAWNAWVIMFIF